MKSKIKSAEEILEKYLKFMLETEQSNYVSIDKMIKTPEYKITLDAIKEAQKQAIEATFPVIRNQLSPITNLIKVVEKIIETENVEINKLILNEIKECKKSINYLVNLKDSEELKII